MVSRGYSQFVQAEHQRGVKTPYGQGSSPWRFVDRFFTYRATSWSMSGDALRRGLRRLLVDLADRHVHGVALEVAP